MASTASGALQGAALGATVGSAVPGVGTAIGAGVGGLLGGAAGWWGGRKTKQQEETDRQRLAAAQQYYQPAAANAQNLYDQALARSQASYQAGNIRDVDLSGADALRGQQVGNLGSLGNAAAGRGPSAAQAQYAAGLAQAQNAALGLAASSRGAGRGAARLQALSQFGAQAGIQAQQAAALRAQEQQSAMAAYTAALQGARGQDIGLATDRAGLVLQRDTAADAANRAAFQATQQAQQGWVNAAGNANSTQADVAGQQADTALGAYNADLEAKKRRDQASAANWNSAISGGTQLAQAFR